MTLFLAMVYGLMGVCILGLSSVILLDIYEDDVEPAGEQLPGETGLEYTWRRVYTSLYIFFGGFRYLPAGLQGVYSWLTTPKTKDEEEGESDA